MAYDLRPRPPKRPAREAAAAPKRQRQERRKGKGKAGATAANRDAAHLDVEGHVLRFRVRKVPRNGHCLYAAMAAVLPGGRRARDLLDDVCAWYIRNWTNDVPGSPGLRVHEALERGVHDAGRYTAQLTDAEGGASYGGIVELVVLATVVDVSVRVFEVDCTATADLYGADDRPVPARVAFAIGAAPYAANLLLHTHGPEHDMNHFSGLV